MSLDQWLINSRLGVPTKSPAKKSRLSAACSDVESREKLGNDARFSIERDHDRINRQFGLFQPPQPNVGAPKLAAQAASLSQMTAINAKLKSIAQIVLVAAGARSAEAAIKVGIAKAASFCRGLALSLADSAGSIDESPKLALHAISLREAARTRLKRCVGVVSARPLELLSQGLDEIGNGLAARRGEKGRPVRTGKRRQSRLEGSRVAAATRASRPSTKARRRERASDL